MIFLHGNTASSKMFDGILDLYTRDFKILLLDFLGHGSSDRLASFPVDFWFDQAMQVAAFLEANDFGRVNVIGSSGGALVALNLALERPDLVDKVIADSFEGERSLDIVVGGIVAEREKSKRDQGAITFWRYNHGEDWESVVDNDTNVMVDHHQKIRRFFHKELSQIKVPVLLTASLEDEYAEYVCFEETFQAMLEKIPGGKVHLFQHGGHPALLSGAGVFAEVAREFLDNGGITI